MDKINPTIINAKPAERHLEKVRVEHAGLVEGLNNHLMKVQQYNMNKDMEAKDQKMRDGETQQKQAEFDQKGEAQKAVSDKANMDYQLKTKELEIKKLALSTPD